MRGSGGSVVLWNPQEEDLQTPLNIFLRTLPVPNSELLDPPLSFAVPPASGQAARIGIRWITRIQFHTFLCCCVPTWVLFSFISRWRYGEKKDLRASLRLLDVFVRLPSKTEWVISWQRRPPRKRQIRDWTPPSGVGIAQLVVCWARCPAWCRVVGSILLWGDFFFPVERIFSLGANMGSDSIPPKLFRMIVLAEV